MIALIQMPLANQFGDILYMGMNNDKMFWSQMIHTDYTIIVYF